MPSEMKNGPAGQLVSQDSPRLYRMQACSYLMSS